MIVFTFETWFASADRVRVKFSGVVAAFFSLGCAPIHPIVNPSAQVAEVARRWLRLCPVRKSPTGEPLEPTAAELDTIRNVPQRLAEIRRRLSDVSWLMRMVAEPIARRANREDHAAGRFWQGRYRMVKLCDEAALLACAVYVDLNPIRAALAESLATSDFTSAQRRIEAERMKSNTKRYWGSKMTSACPGRGATLSSRNSPIRRSVRRKWLPSTIFVR